MSITISTQCTFAILVGINHMDLEVSISMEPAMKCMSLNFFAICFFIETLNCDVCMCMSSCGRMIVKLFITHIETHWRIRNENLHGKNKETQEREILQEQIRKLKQEKYFVPKKLRKLHKSGGKLHNDPNFKISTLRRWVSIITDLKVYHEHCEKIQIKNGGDIRTYLNSEYAKV